MSDHNCDDHDSEFGCRLCAAIHGLGKGQCEWCKKEADLYITKAWDEAMEYALCRDCQAKNRPTDDDTETPDEPDEEILIEQCVLCRRVHRYGDLRAEAVHHYHWGKPETEQVLVIRQSTEWGSRNVSARIHRTLCACHVCPNNWLKVWKLHREHIEPKFVVPGSYNAPLITGLPGWSKQFRSEMENKYLELCSMMRGSNPAIKKKF